MYDHTGVMGFTYQGQTYFYQKDLQGNIVTIVNAAGAPMAQYYYDAWGNHKVYDGDYITEMTSPTFIGNLNPFRYRGYYYDTETKLYYLKSRYYDPEVGRFISADTVNYAEPSKFDGLNLFAYCNNNPVMFVDPDGHTPWWRWVISGVQLVAGFVLCATGVGAGVGAPLIVGGAIGMITNIFGDQIGAGVGSMLNGYGAISTGCSLYSFGWIGAILGTALVLVGVATSLMGANEIASGISGQNNLRPLIGEELYDELYIGLNIVSSIGTIGGRLGMRAYGTQIGHVSGKAMPYARITDDYKTVQYDDSGKLYWSIHRTNHGRVTTSNPHWHTGAGRDKHHFKSYFELLLYLIFQGRM